MFFIFFDDETKQTIEKLKEDIKKGKGLDMYSYVKLLETLNAGEIEKLREMLEANIREEAAKTSGNRKPLSIINSMMKSKEVKNNKNMYNAYSPTKDGRYAFIDGHRIFFSDTDLGFKKAEQPLNIESIINTDFDYECEINIQAVKEKIAFNKANKTKEPYIIQCDDFVVGINPNYAKDLVDYTGNTKLKFSKKTSIDYKCQTTPLYSVDENGKLLAIVLPVAVRNQTAKKEVA